MPTRNSKDRRPEMSIDLGHITRADLTDDRRFKALYAEFVKRRWLPGNANHILLEFAAYAEKALAEDTHGTPGRLFYALIKAWEGRITNDQEHQAMVRFSGMDRDMIVFEVEEALKQVLDDPAPAPSPLLERNIGFLPAATVQCFFPQKRLPDGVRKWDVSHGHTTLRVRAGDISDRNNPDQFRDCDVPYGRLARLLFAYVIGQSVKTQSPTIDMGPSLRKFMTRLGISYDGRAGKKLTEAVEDLAAADFILGQWGDGAVRTQYARVVDEVSFWLEPDDGQRTFWTPEIVLSDKFHEQVQAHRVPVDMDHLALLMRSPRRMDVYTWLAYRTAQIPRGRSVRVPLKELQPLFAPDIAEFRLFKQRLQGDLKAVAKVWPHFNVDVQGDVLVLRWSESPVPSRPLIQGN